MHPEPRRRLSPLQKRLPGGRTAVTICVGVRCKDGLLIAADRQMTSPSYTFHECKLHSLKWKNGRAVWGFTAKNADILNIFWPKLEERFATDAVITRGEIADALKEVLSATLSKKEHFATLFGAWTDGENSILLHSEGTIVMETGPWEIIGYGDSPLSRYLRGMFLKCPNRTVFQASMMAIYLVRQAKTYDGQYVGGGTDVYMIDENHCTRVIDVAQTDILEKEMQRIEVITMALFATLSDSASSSDWIERRYKEFRGKVDPFCERIRQMK